MQGGPDRSRGGAEPTSPLTLTTGLTVTTDHQKEVISSLSIHVGLSDLSDLERHETRGKIFPADLCNYAHTV